MFLGFFLNFFLTLIYFWDRERQHEWGRVRERRERDTESETGSRLWAVSTEPEAGLELTDHEIMTWAEVGNSTDWATQAPLKYSGHLNEHRGAWVAQSVKWPTLAQVMISWSVSSSPASGSVLTAQSLGPVSDSVSPSLWPSPVHALSLSQK